MKEEEGDGIRKNESFGVEKGDDHSHISHRTLDKIMGRARMSREISLLHERRLGRRNGEKRNWAGMRKQDN